MKPFLLIVFMCYAFLMTHAQDKGIKTIYPDKNKKILTVETACGECQFGMQGNGCDLAIRLNRKSYFVDGTDIDSHGDAHADDGFCNTIRKAKIQGVVKKNRYKVTYFQILPGSEPKGKSN